MSFGLNQGPTSAIATSNADDAKRDDGAGIRAQTPHAHRATERRSPLEPDARIEPGVQQIDEKSHADQHRRIHDHHPQHQRVIAIERALHQVAADARQVRRSISTTSEPVMMEATAGAR